MHAYPKGSDGVVTIKCQINGDELQISVIDEGVGIKDVKKALEPFYTTKPQEERSGMGFAVMESFMDSVEVFNNNDKGLTVVMKKRIAEQASEAVSD